jgi:L-fuconolactonase
MSSEVEILYRDYLPSQLQPILSANGVDQTVLVQASNSVEESRWLLSLADQNLFITGVVGWVDLLDPGVTNQIEELSAHPKFKGVRHLVESEPADDWLTQPVVLKGLRQLAEHNLSYDLLVHTRHLPHVRTVAEHCPDLRLVIDHMAKPPIARGEFKEWSEQLGPLASFKNVHCKLSGLVTQANWTAWQTDDLRPYVNYALQVFGPERMMFGSDHPVCLLAASYERVLETFLEILKDLDDEERTRILAQNATDFYQLN